MAETAIQKRDIEIGEGGLVKLDTYESAYRFAQSVVKSGLAPKSFQSPEAVLVAMQQGAELGLKPMQSLQHIAVINGRPSIYGKAATGIVMQSGLVEVFEEWFEGEGDDLTAFCKVKRKGLQSVKTAKFSMADAKKANLIGKQVWREYTNDMLMYKARARAFTIFNDVLCGLSFAEDISEVPEARKSFTEPKAGNSSDPLLKELEIEEVEAEPITTESGQPEPEPKIKKQKSPRELEAIEKHASLQLKKAFAAEERDFVYCIKQMLWEMAGEIEKKDKTKRESEAGRLLYQFSTFEGDDGNMVDGFTAFDYLETLLQTNPKRLKTLYGIVKTKYLHLEKKDAQTEMAY